MLRRTWGLKAKDIDFKAKAKNLGPEAKDLSSKAKVKDLGP